MTYQDFLAALRATPREWWYLTPDGRIRAKVPKAAGACCPITAVDGRHLLASYAWNVGGDLGLSPVTREDIILAADWSYDHARERLSHERADLLAACGLGAQA